MTGRRYTSGVTTVPTDTTKEDSMRTLLPRASRRVLLAGAAVIALAAAGIAIADPGSPASTKPLSATFYANTLVNSHSNTCTPTPPGDAFTSTDVTFTGAASGDPRLTGPLTVHVKSVYDTTQNAGTLKGDVDINSTTTPPGHVHARLTAVQIGSNVQGWLDGDLGGGTHFIGSFTGTFSTTGGFSSSGTPASIGAGSGTNMAVAWSGHCESPHPNQHHDNGDDNDQGDHHHGH
jgi:hypothetical protein